MRVLALGPESYGGFAGIAQGTRDYLGGLLSDPSVEGIQLLARRAPDGGPPPPSGIEQEVSAGWSPLFARRAVELAVERSYDLVFCLHVNLMPVAALLKRMFGTPIWLSIHGIDAWAPPASLLRRRSIEAADFVTSSSRYTRERFLDWSPLLPEQVEVNSNPVHLERWAPGPKPQALLERYGLRDHRVLLTVGRMLGGDRLKGHDEILRALPGLLNTYPDLKWLIVGNGPDRGRIESNVRSAGLSEHVVFAGRIPEEEKADHYRVADAYALPSRTEGFGIAYLEAAACGLPLLGSVLDGSRDPLCDGAMGILVDPGDPRQVEDGLRRLMAQPKRVPAELERFSYACLEARMQRMMAERFRSLRRGAAA